MSAMTRKGVVPLPKVRVNLFRLTMAERLSRLNESGQVVEGTGTISQFARQANEGCWPCFWIACQGEVVS